MAGTAHAVPAFVVRMSKFWPRALGRAANLMMLTPSTECIFQGKAKHFLSVVARIVASAREPARRAARRHGSCLGVTVIGCSCQSAPSPNSEDRSWRVSIIPDIEIANWLRRSSVGARRMGRCNANSCAVVPQVAPSPSVDARAQVFLRPALPCPCAVTMAISHGGLHRSV